MAGRVRLKNKPDGENSNYSAVLVRNHEADKSKWRGFDGSWILLIQKIQEDGVEHLTPGQWFLDTLLKFDSYGRSGESDTIYIDAGTNWKVTNMKKILKEAEKIAYGSEDPYEILESETLYPTLVEGIKDYENTPRMRNWYQKQDEVKKPIRKPKMSSKVSRQIEILEDEIYVLKQSLKDERLMARELELNRENFLGWIQDQYDWNVLDILSSGFNDSDKKRRLELWNAKQDRKDKMIPNIDNLIKEYNENSDEPEDKIEDIVKEIEEKTDEITRLSSMYESMNEGLSKRVNFKRFEDEVLRPLAEETGVEFRIGRIGNSTSVGKKITERYYGIGPLTILVRDTKRIGMPGDDVEPWIMDSKNSSRGISFGSEWGSYKKFKEKIKELLTPEE